MLRVKVPSGLVCGDVDEGYGAVADAFRRNFARGEEIGAACAVYRDGRPVVDLWGGYLAWLVETHFDRSDTRKSVPSRWDFLLFASGPFTAMILARRAWPMRPTPWCLSMLSVLGGAWP